jgi:Trypsin
MNYYICMKHLHRWSPSQWTVYAGDVDLEGNGERRNSAEFIVHEGYDPENYFTNDIGLIRVSFLALRKSFL